MNKNQSKAIPMHAGARSTQDLLAWVRLSIADAIVLFGRLEHELIEIAWLIKGADLKERVKIARNSATYNFLNVIAIVEEAAGARFDALRETFVNLANDRNLMVHGAWLMVDGRPWVVWHKFLVDTESVIGEFFDKPRFEAFMKKADILLDTSRKFHSELEASSGVRTSVPRGN
jgi:hypothetical protein